MRKEVKSQTKMGCRIDLVWKALAKDVKLLLPILAPNLVKDVQLIQGDGGLGTVYLFNFGPDVGRVRYQKEKISEYNESVHRLGFEVIEGGHLLLGFSHYETIFQLTSSSDRDDETLIDFTVTYESSSQSQSQDHDDDVFTSNTISSTLAFLKILENYLLSS
ncbi:Major strawberry allergen Fra a 1-A [Euphorbia peplus]|nr:Major strawberry allergen Fra a 1-A [Euphorbia peplus]